MNLLPVVEFEPACYQTQHHEIPEYGACDAWVAYWKNSLADSGIIGLEPYADGSWFVETERLLSNLEAIEIMLKIKVNGYLKEFDDEELRDNLSSLCGGYILEVNEHLKIYPQCCGRLEDIHEWKQACDWISPQEMTLWIGHPWLMVSSINTELLQFRRTSEYKEPPEPVIFNIKRYDLRLAVVSAEKKLLRFQQVMLPILEKLLPIYAKDIVNVLIYGQY